MNSSIKIAPLFLLRSSSKESWNGEFHAEEHPWKLFIYSAVKRFFDIFISLLALMVLAPVMVVLAIAIRIQSPGPAIFCQRRLTAGGKVFTMFKFRTMVPNAEKRSGAVWAAKNDPRITPFGNFLRKTRLDELPQLLNVLIGDMSLIGPRPERPEFALELSRTLPSFNRRTEVKAGLTGLAQVEAGYASSVSEYRKKLAFDILYVKKRCLWLDLSIAIRTIRVIFTGDGAR